MRAAVYRGVNDLRIETVPVPRIRAGELLVRVAVCGVCPTDIKKIQYGTVAPPRIFGHETAGTIVRVGARVSGFNVGQRVALHHHVPCLRCHFCAHRAFAQCLQYKRTGITAGFEPAGGGFAEYVRVMACVLPGVVRIPKPNTFVEGAMLEPVNTVLKAVHRLALQPFDRVLVVGQGPIGLMFTRLLTLQKASVIVADLLEERLALARRWGARSVVNPQRKSLENSVDEFTRGRGLDAVVVAVPSNDVVGKAQQLTRGGGRVLLFAHTRRGEAAPIELARICVDEKDLIGSYSADFLLQEKVARLVFTRQIDIRRLVSHEFPLPRTAEAIDWAAKPRPGALKIVVNCLGDKGLK